MHIKLVTRSLLAGVVCLTALTATKHGVNAAAKPKPLDKSYFFGLQYSCGDCWPASIAIAGETFTGTSMNLFHEGDHVSLNARKLPAYNAVAFKIGCSDASEVGTKAVLKVFGDAATTPIATYTVLQGQPARLQIIPFNGHGTLNFEKQLPAQYNDCEFVIANPSAIVLGPPPAAALTISSPTVAAGGQETMTVAARPATQATVVISYASGVQQVIGPTNVATSGQLSATFSVAQGVHGVARVTVVTATGEVHGTFTVTG